MNGILREGRESNTKKGRKILIWLVLLLLLLAAAIAWVAVRLFAGASCTPWEGPEPDPDAGQEKVLSAMSLSFLVYGMETCEAPEGTVAEILDREKMGILLENADILRTDPSDPSTAVIDSASFIRQQVGGYRLLTELRDSRSSFYGAAFADDATRTVWIAYAGSVSWTDAFQSLQLAAGAGLSGQEKKAFALYETVLETEEIRAGYRLVLTGHSLGGGLAAMVSCLSGAEAVTISGAVGVALDKINGITGRKPDSYRIANYLTSPKNGKTVFRDLIQRMLFLGSWEAVETHVYRENRMTSDTHCVFSFIQFTDGDLSKPVLPAEEIAY